MFQKTKTKKKRIGTSTGASTEVPESGWRSLRDSYPNGAKFGNREDQLVNTLFNEGLGVIQTGSRNQSHDLMISSGTPEIPEGVYEVKSLYRRNENCRFDRRFKTGRRGEDIYGRRDAEIKAAALDIENYLDHGVTSGLQFIESAHRLIDEALNRKHSKDFLARFTLLAEAYSDTWMLSSADRFLLGGVSNSDILKGFSGLDGIFLLAGPMYVLVKPKEFSKFIAFDSVSSEGVKLRYTGMIPSEKND